MLPITSFDQIREAVILRYDLVPSAHRENDMLITSLANYGFIEPEEYGYLRGLNDTMGEYR